MTRAEAKALQDDPKVYGRIMAKALKANPAMRRKTTGHKWTGYRYFGRKP